MPEIRVVKLDPPQPCGMFDPIRRRICGKPATAATVEAARIGPTGYLLVLPMCEACVRAMQQIYPPSSRN